MRRLLMMALVAGACGGTGGPPLAAQQVLETPGYIVIIRQTCPEGVVVCDRAFYHGLSKKSGKAMTLRGETLHTTCADGETPCRFIGWRFRSGDVNYLVLQDGTLEVRKGKRLLLRQQGHWLVPESTREDCAGKAAP